MHVSLKAIVIIGAVLLLTWTSGTQAREAVIGYSGRTIAEMPFAWASRKGFFKEANLDVKMIYMSTSIAAKGLMSGDVDYSGCTFCNLFIIHVIGVSSRSKIVWRLRGLFHS